MDIMSPIGSAPTVAEDRPCRSVSLDLREVRAFLTVARHGNFARAARELSLSQPTVSHQVQRLEHSVGASLLARHGRGATLTPAGITLRTRLGPVAQALRAPLDADGAADTVSGVVRLGVPAELAPVLLPSLVAELRSAWPHLRLDVREGATAALEEWTLAGQLDVAVLQDAPNLDALDVTPVVSEPLGLVADVRAALAQSSGPARLRELSDAPLILASERHWIRRRLANAAFRYGVLLNPIMEIESLATLKSMLRNGLGCTVLPRVAVQDEILRGSVIFRELEQPGLLCTHAVATPAGADTPIQGVATSVRRVMSRLVEKGAWSGAEMLAPADGVGPTERWLPELADQQAMAVPA